MCEKVTRAGAVARSKRRQQSVGRRNQAFETASRDAFADVEDQLHAERQLIDCDTLHLLADALVGHDEVGRHQPPNRRAIAVDDRHVEAHDVDATREGWRRLLRLARRSLRGHEQSKQSEEPLHGRCASARSPSTSAPLVKHLL